MEHRSYDYAVIGGDMRQVYLAEELALDANVCHYALCELPEKSCCYDTDASAVIKAASWEAAEVSPLTEASSLEEICRASSCIICPIPFSRDGVYINHCFHTNQSAYEEPLSMDLLLSNLQSDQFFFAGCIPEYFNKEATEKGVQVVDLMQNSSLAFFNSIATTEGAICEAIKRSPVNLHQSSCAVLGYGKCGHTIVQYLHGMFCYLYVAADQEEERAQAAILADRTGSLKAFGECAEEFDFIFNTIPSVVIDSELLKKLKNTATIIDIASAPGGVDYTAAQKLGVNATFCPGLPGKYAPYSSAKAMKKTIRRIQEQVSK